MDIAGRSQHGAGAGAKPLEREPPICNPARDEARRGATMTIEDVTAAPPVDPRGSTAEVLLAFLKLGLSSFGGPIAHIGYFRNEFVLRRRWLDEKTYADLVALCQFLPGPASSQVGFSIGLMRAGYPGALAAWTGFTLPSAIAMVLFAYGADALVGPLGSGLLHGLKLVAVAIVAQAVWGMARTLCPDRPCATIATVAALIILFSASSLAQIGAIVLGGITGLWLCRAAPPSAGGRMAMPVSRAAGLAALTAFFVLLGGLPLLRRLTDASALALFEAFYRSGALVFGGGHVVLPLLREAFVTPGWLNDDAFLAGYGAAQAVPGPLFTFAAYLGAVVSPSPHGIAGAALGLAGIFIPGILILLGTLPFWDTFRKLASAQAMMRGVNAAVVGLLGAALYNPVWVSSVHAPADFAVALAGFVLLTVWGAAPLAVVIVSALAGMALAMAG
jgi:chromate transporter